MATLNWSAFLFPFGYRAFRFCFLFFCCTASNDDSTIVRLSSKFSVRSSMTSRAVTPLCEPHPGALRPDEEKDRTAQKKSTCRLFPFQTLLPTSGLPKWLSLSITPDISAYLLLFFHPGSFIIVAACWIQLDCTFQQCNLISGCHAAVSCCLLGLPGLCVIVNWRCRHVISPPHTHARNIRLHEEIRRTRKIISLPCAGETEDDSRKLSPLCQRKGIVAMNLYAGGGS